MNRHPWLHATLLCGSLVGTPWLAACSADGSDSGDAGGIRALDDASGQPDAMATADAPTGVQLAGESTDSDPTFQACFNGEDDNGLNGADCEDAACSTTPPCCIGVGVAACCASSPITTSLTLAACPNVAGCAGLRVVSGFPEISEGRLTMVSATNSDAIVDLPSWPVSTRAERIVLRAAVTTRAESTLAVEAVAFGLWPGNNTATTVNPDVAVVVSATRRDVSLVVGSRVVSSRPMAPGVTAYELSVEPSGAVTLTPFPEASLDDVQTIHVELPQRPSVPVVFGRVSNDEPDAASITSLELRRFACDIPAAIDRAGALTFQGAQVFDARSVSDPTVLVDGSLTRIAFSARSSENTGTALYLGVLSGGEIQGAMPLVQPSDVASFGRVTDLAGPSLVMRGDRLDLYFAYRIGDAWDVGVQQDVLGTPTLQPLSTPEGSYDDPTVLGDALLVRQRLEGGRTRFVRMDASLADASSFSAAPVCGADATCTAETPSSDYILENSGEVVAFDRDEIRAPAVVQTPSTTRIFYAGRRGTRWSIGMLQSSGSGLYFRAANEGNALLSGTGAGLEALGVSSPTAWIHRDELHMVYAASDGEGWSLFHASQPIHAR